MSWRNSPTRTPDPVYEQVEDLAEESTRSLLENENPKVPDLTEKQLDDLLFNATTNSNSAFQMAGLTYRLVGQNSRIHLVLVGLLGLNSVLLVAVLIMLAG